MNTEPPSSVTQREMLALLKEVVPFLTFDKGSVCIRVAYMKGQDDLRNRILSVIAQADDPS